MGCRAITSPTVYVGFGMPIRESV